MSPFARQLFVAGSPMLAALSVGGAASYPTVLLHQLRANDSSFPLDFDTSSWIGSINGIAGIPSIFLPNIMQWRGRKFAFIAACLITIMGWIVAYTANSAGAILVSECFHGLGTNSILAVSYLSITEMMSPVYRQPYMNLYAVLQTFTMAMNGMLAQYLHWRTISLVMCLPMIIAVVMACMWPESPYWLAIKGRYDKCEKAFVWLRGQDEDSKKEFEELIHAQKENTVTNRRSKMTLKKFLTNFTKRDFYLPCLHMFVLQYLFYFSGNYVILIYSIDLIQKVTQNSSVAFYGGFIMNMIVCLGIIISIVLTRYFKKKRILLCCSFVGAISMLAASIFSYLQSVDVLNKTSTLCLYSLIGYMIANGLGIVPIAYNIAIEIMPVKHRGIGGALIVVTSCILHTTSLKISPYLFIYIDLWGTFLFFTLNTMFCAVFIWKYVPETTGRTLQEIEYYYEYGNNVNKFIIDDDECVFMDEEMEVFNVVHKNELMPFGDEN